MHSALASALTAATRGRIRPPRRATAYITSGTPWPRASRAKTCTSGPYSRPATTGAATTNQRPSTEVCIGRAWHGRVVGVPRQHSGRGTDQPAESDRADSRAEADQDGEDLQPGAGASQPIPGARERPGR